MTSDADPAFQNGHAQRSAITRAKLIDATIEHLFRFGYAATTTIAVAKGAGVSRGAMLHQFPMRVDLIIAVAEHIVRDQDQRRRTLLRDFPRGLERFRAITSVVWQTMQEPASIALIEIMLGSRSDPELASRFPGVMNDLESKLVEGPIEVADDIGINDRRQLLAMTRLHMAAMRGLIIERLFQPDSSSVEDAFDLLSWYKDLAVDRLTST